MADMELTHAANGKVQSAPQSRLQRTVLGLTILLAAWLISAVADGGFDRYHLPKELALSLSAALCCASFALRPRLPRDLVSYATLAGLGLALLSAFFATSPALATRALALHASVAVLFLTVRTLPAAYALPLLAWVVVAAGGVALLALAESFGLVSGLSRAGRAPGSTLGQRNAVAHFLVLASPAAWQLACAAPNLKVRLLFAGLSAILAAVVLLTRSRAGWLGFSLALAVFALSELSGRRGLRLGPLLVALLLGVTLAYVTPSKLAWREADPYAESWSRLFESERGSGAGRLSQYRVSLDLVALHPVLGTGPGNWMVEYPRVTRADDPAFRRHAFLHTGRLANSDWIALLTEQGPLALACLVLLALALLGASVHAPLRSLGWACGAGLVLLGALDAVLQLPTSACTVALLLGLASTRPEPLEPPPASRFTRYARGVALSLALLLVLGSVQGTRRLLALRARTSEPGYAAMEAAVAWNGADLSARLTLAEAYVLAGRCREAEPHLAALRSLLPYHRALRDLTCGRSD